MTILIPMLSHSIFGTLQVYKQLGLHHHEALLEHSRCANRLAWVPTCQEWDVTGVCEDVNMSPCGVGDHHVVVWGLGRNANRPAPSVRFLLHAPTITYKHLNIAGTQAGMPVHPGGSPGTW